MIKQSILIINTSKIGDIIATLSVTKLLSKYYVIDYFVLEHFQELLIDQSFINVLSNKSLTTKQYDFLIDMTSSPESRKLVKQVNAQKKIGLYKNYLNYLKRRFHYNILVKKKKYNQIVKDHYVFLEPFSKYVDLSLLGNYPQLENTSKIYEKYITLHIGARNPIRQIPLQLQYDIIEFLEANYKLPIYILGDEEATIEKLLHKYSFLKFKKTNLLELKKIIASSVLFIGPDSGLLHISSAYNIPSIGIYGPNLPSISGTLNPIVDYIEEQFDCRPCNQNIQCPYAIKCLTTINRETLFNTIQNKLATNVQNHYSP